MRICTPRCAPVARVVDHTVRYYMNLGSVALVAFLVAAFVVFVERPLCVALLSVSSTLSYLAVLNFRHRSESPHAHLSSQLMAAHVMLTCRSAHDHSGVFDRIECEVKDPIGFHHPVAVEPVHQFSDGDEVSFRYPGDVAWNTRTRVLRSGPHEARWRGRRTGTACWVPSWSA
jgi:hypothetical protein